MAVSEERINELLEQMLNEVDDDGWCHMPKGLSDEEEEELTNKLTLITMEDRLEGVLKGVLTVFEFFDLVTKDLDDYDKEDKTKIIDVLTTVKEDAQTILMDLHSSDIIFDFFKIDLLSNKDTKIDLDKTKDNILKIIDTELSESLENLKNYCISIVEISDNLKNKL